MILNDVEIRNRSTDYNMYEMNSPLIVPFNEKQLQCCSYDLTIDNEIISIKCINNVVDVKDQSQVDNLYEITRITSDGFILIPHCYVLVTLRETIYIPPELTAHLRPKTRFIRAGIMVSGQHINPDSFCKLKLGMINCSSNPIRLYSGMPIAQVVFEKLTDSPSPEKQCERKKERHYINDIDFIGAKFTNELNNYIDGKIDQWLN